MKKLITLLLVLTGMVSTASAATETTVYYAVPSTTVGTYTVKLNINRKGDGDDWISYTMTKTAKTFRGDDIYTCTYTDLYDGVGKMQFQLYNGDKHVSQQEPYSNWTSASTYNGKMYVHDKGWTIYNYDTDTKSITIHCKKTDTWTPNHGYAFYNNGSADVKLTDDWTGNVISANANNSDYYDLTINSSVNSVTVIFNNGISGQGTNQTWDISIGSNAEYWTMGDDEKGGYAAGPECWKATTEAPDDWIGYTRSVTSGYYGTICLPYAATITGATIYKIKSTVGSGESLTGINIEAVDGNAVEAGKAYIFKATDATLTATYSGSYTEATAGYGMMGNLGGTIKAPEGSYVVGNDNKIHKVVSGGNGVNVGQYKGYITLKDIPAGARSANFIAFEDGGATAIDVISKMEDVRGDVYNLNGQRVSQPTKGLYIVNGKKVIIK